MATVREVFETNTFGVMAMTQAVLPQLRAQEVVRGRECDLERDAGDDAADVRVHREQDDYRRVHRIARARARSVQLRVKLVEPGYGPTTRFASNVGTRMEGLFPEAYAAFTKPILASFAQVTAVTTASDVAEAVYRAATVRRGSFGFPADPDAVAPASRA